MTTFIIILNLVAVPIFYMYVFVKKRKNTYRYHYKIMVFSSYTVAFNILLCYLFYLDMILSWNRLFSIFLWIPAYAIFALTGHFSRKYSNDHRGFSILLFITKIMNMVLFVPMIVIYLLHNSSIESIYTWSILIPLTLIIVFLIYQVMLQKPFSKFFLKINGYGFTLFFIAILFFAIIARGNNTFMTRYLSSEGYSEVATNKSISQIANFEMDLTDNRIRDFIYKDNYLYFVTISSNYGVQDIIYLTIYSIEDNEIVYQHESKESGEDNRWLIKEDRYLLEHNNYLYFLTATGLFLIEDNELEIVSSATIYDSYFFRDEDDYFIARDESDEELNTYLLLEGSIVFEENLLGNDFTGYPHENNDQLMYIDKDENKITLSTGMIYELPVLDKEFKVHTITEEYLIIEEYMVNDHSKDYFYKINGNNEVKKINFNENRFFTEYSVYYDLIYPSTYMYSHSTETLTLYDGDLQSVEEYVLRNGKYSYNDDGIIYLVRFFENTMYFTSTVEEGNKLYIEFSTFAEIKPTVEYEYFKFISFNTIFFSIFLIIIPANGYKKNENNGFEIESDDEFIIDEFDENQESGL